MGKARDVALVDPEGHSLVELTWLALGPGMTRRHDIELGPKIKLKKILTNKAGAPVAGARVVALMIPKNINYTDKKL